MKKPKLTKEEDEDKVYLEIIAIASQAIKDMFLFGYVIGRKRLFEEISKEQRKKIKLK